MAILYTFPNTTPNTNEWEIVTNSIVFTSPLSKTTQVVELPGARWSASLSFTDIEAAEKQLLNLFLTKLRGPSGIFKLHDHSYKGPQGDVSGTPIMVASQQIVNTTFDTDSSWDKGSVWNIASGGYRDIEKVEITAELAGTGYTASDIITLEGGTATVKATVQIVSVDGGGAVTAVTLINEGKYSVYPTSPITTFSGVASGTGLSLDITEWPGGYAVDDVLTILGGTYVTFATTLKVETITAEGIILTVSKITEGDYTVVPTSPASTFGGVGEGATFNYASGWLIINNEASKVAGTTTSYLSQNIIGYLPNGLSMKVQFDLTSFSSGSIWPLVGGQAGSTIVYNENYDQTTTYSMDVTSGGIDELVGLKVSADFVGVIDNLNIWVKRDAVYSTGWDAPEGTTILYAGEYIEIDSGELKIVIEDVVSIGTGIAIIEVEPPMRDIRLGVANIITNNPSCIMRLTDDSQVRWSNQGASVTSDISFSVLEVI